MCIQNSHGLREFTLSAHMLQNPPPLASRGDRDIYVLMGSKILKHEHLGPSGAVGVSTTGGVFGVTRPLVTWEMGRRLLCGKGSIYGGFSLGGGDGAST